MGTVAKRASLQLRRRMQSIGRQLSQVIPAWLPFLVAFVLIPGALYLPNQKEFDLDLCTILPFVLAAALSVVPVLLLVLVGQPLRTVVIRILFLFGFFLLLSDLVAPLEMGQLTGSSDQAGIAEPIGQTLAEATLAGVLVFCAYLLKGRQLPGFAPWFVLALVIVQAAWFVAWLSPESRLVSPHAPTVPEPKPSATTFNVYHLTFDGYIRDVFLTSAEKAGAKDLFEGFVFFRQNRSNYFFTTVSTTSYMTGSLYRPGTSLRKWINSKPHEGVPKVLHNAGYTVWNYVDQSWWVHTRASHAITNQQIRGRSRLPVRICHFADLWLLRLVPTFLRTDVYRDGKGPFSRLLIDPQQGGGEDSRPVTSVMLMRRLIADEEKRPGRGQYVHAHIYLPHEPYVLDGNCAYCSRSDYARQAVCATRLMAEFLTKLKKMGRYRESVIVIQSDHGTRHLGSIFSLPKSNMSRQVSNEINATNLLRRTAEEIDALTRSLLLVKPPRNAKRSLEVSDRPTQLADVPATIYGLLGLPVRTEAGISVLSTDLPEKRAIDVYVGYTQRTEDGEWVQFGTGGHRGIDSGEMNHYSYIPGDGWTVHPNIPVKWE